MNAITCEWLDNSLIANSLYQEYDIIGIDEAQFFDDVVNACEMMAKNGKVVIVAGLDATY